MRSNYVAAGVGAALAVAGVALVGYGVLQAAGEAGADCGDSCDALWPFAFPAGIIALVGGLILGGFGFSSIRAERGITGPLAAFGIMTGLGLVFLVLGVVLLFGSTQGGDGEADGTFLFLGGLFFLMGLGFAASDLWRFRSALKRDRLRVSGIRGTATVVGVGDSNVTVNNSPLVNLDLEVNLPGQAPFRARRRTLISRLSVGALTNGTVLPVLADPARPKDVMIDWNDTASAAPGVRVTSLGTTLGLAGASTFQSGSGTLDRDMLRLISQALAGAADRVGHGATETHLADGTTMIDGGTTVIVDGRPVDLGGSSGTTLDLSAVIRNVLAAAASTTAVPRPSGSGPVSGGGPSPNASGPGSPAPGEVQGLAPGPETVPARVNLDSIRDSGVDIAGSRLYTFDLTVSVAGRASYQTTFASVVPAGLVPRLVQGASFPADVDPDRPAGLSVHWDR